MAKLRWWIGALSNTWGLLLVTNPMLGLIGFTWRSIGLTPISILKLSWPHSRLFMAYHLPVCWIIFLVLPKWLLWISYYRTDRTSSPCWNRIYFLLKQGRNLRLICIDLIQVLLLVIGFIWSYSLIGSIHWGWKVSISFLLGSMDPSRLCRRLVKWHINLPCLLIVLSTQFFMYHAWNLSWDQM